MNNLNTNIENRINIAETPYRENFCDLLDRVDQCMQADLSEEEQFQNCFWVSLKSYRKLKHLVLENGFGDEQEEIDFFRNVKPAFTSFLEFFTLSGEALWIAQSKAECSSVFWKEEMEKYSRFCKRHYSFVHYYSKGLHDCDKEYFLKATADPISDIQSKIFDESPALHSSKDWIVRSFLAHKMYFRFAQDKLEAFISARKEKLESAAKKIALCATEILSPASIPFSQLLLSYLQHN